MDPGGKLVDGTELCTRCGLCCQGILHDHVPLSGAEAEMAAGKGAALGEAHGGGSCLETPCGFLKGTLCSIYGERPAVCSGYRCGLLERYSAGEIGFEAALDLVAEGQRLVDAAMASLEPGQSFRDARREWRRRRDGWQGEGKRDPAATARFLAFTALAVFSDRHFRADFEERWVIPR